MGKDRALDSERTRVETEIRQVEMELVELEKTKPMVPRTAYEKEKARFKGSLARLVERRDKLGGKGPSAPAGA
ncbi:MAG: hypothetical protein HY722_10980 [Planctomycetes bacterium]|nr:hypothetical protein [Planctomycetota bacterium]